MNGRKRNKVRSALALALCLGFLGRLPAVTVEVDAASVGMGSVAFTQQALGEGLVRLQLKATAASGRVFAGWWAADGIEDEWSWDLRLAEPSEIVVSESAQIFASFADCAEDALSFDLASEFTSFEYGESVSIPLEVDSLSYPKLTFSGLPEGLSFDAKKMAVSGTAKEPGRFVVTVTGSNGSGAAFRQVFETEVGDRDSERLSPYATEIRVGEYFHARFEELFYVGGETNAVRITGTPPPGLTWQENWELLYGTPTKAGAYVLEARVTFTDGATETATTTIIVTDPEPDEYGVDLTGLEDLSAGDVIESRSCEIGTYAKGEGVLSVSGLPTGLRQESWSVSGVRHYGIVGTVRKAGRFEVTVKVAETEDEETEEIETRRAVIVADVPDDYLRVVSTDEALGTVSGGGAVSPELTNTVTAVAAKGAAFAGWYDEDGYKFTLEENVDFRSPTLTFAPWTEYALLSLQAFFVSAEEDGEVFIDGLEDERFECVTGEPFETAFTVESLSLPTLSFSGLPSGLVCTTVENGFLLSYDPETHTAALTPGRYRVRLTAVNASKARAVADFTITVSAQTDERVHVLADYGEFAPNETIDPIDLSGAVDFAAGETLKVSGLPKGLAYNDKANAKKGIEAHTITGTPTVPGDYTLTFTAKVVTSVTTNVKGKVSTAYETVKVLSFMTILPLPEVAVDVDEEAAEAGCKVSGTGNYKSGTKVTLKATAAKGWVFAGWDMLEVVEGLAALSPTLTFVSGDEDLWGNATFVRVAEDALFVDEPSLTESGYAAEWPLKEELGEESASLIADLIATVSWPTVTVSGLPSGVKFTASTLQLSGKPTKSGVFHVTVTAKNAGGYTFVRVLDVAVLNADGTLPEEAALTNAAQIDFAPLEGLVTGVAYEAGAVVLAVGAQEGTGKAVKKVSVSGLPAGLAATVQIAEGVGEVEITGTPTKPGRFVVTVSVSYEGGKSAKSQAAVVVEDGGAQYLYLYGLDEDGGTVSGGGVYAAGANVSLVAKAKNKHVFAGWCADAEGTLFSPLADRDGIDPRTTSVKFPFRPSDFADECVVYGAFAASADDAAPEILFEQDLWEIDPAVTSEFLVRVESISLPKVTVKGLPKGVAYDAVRGFLAYTPTTAATPGVYSVVVSARNTTVSKNVSRTQEVFVANRTSEVIGGLDPAQDAYPLTVGVALDAALIVPEVAEGWKLTAKGLPSGLSFKNGVVTGVPTKAGDYTVTFTAVSGSGSAKQTETATITLRIAALPTNAAGTYNGFLLAAEAEEEVVLGTLALTVGQTGKISASAKVPSGTMAFSGASWAALEEGVLTADVTGKNGATLTLALDTARGEDENQVTGRCLWGGREYEVVAQRKLTGLKDLAGTTTMDGWKVQVKAAGTAQVSGKYAGKSVSGSAFVYGGDPYYVRYVKFLDKKTALTVTFLLDSTGQITSYTTEEAEE